MSTEPQPAPRELHAGDVLDRRYRLVDRLGRGGFGDVWRAAELLPDGEAFREVALKLLISGVTDVVSWAEEAKLLASFRHPSLVTIYAAGILDPAQPFVAMELLLGETCSDRVKARGKIPWRRALAWMRDVAAALDVIHEKGVVHLDLKPHNLFVTSEGTVKVLDFGIARRAGAAPMAAHAIPPGYRVMADDANVETAAFVAVHADDAYAATKLADGARGGGSTTRRAVVGTPGFMAPEVIGDGEATAASDAYALAVCFVQLSTGRLPHDVEADPEWSSPSSVSAWLDRVRAATLRGELRDLAADPAKLPPGVVALARRLLAVDPAARRVEAGKLRKLFDEAWERPWGVPDPPYPGLGSIDARSEGMLFGRSDDVSRLGRELEFASCVVVHGPRGAGKSSLVRAGLVPHLARAGADGKDDWIAVDVAPGEDPDGALERALAAIEPDLAGAGADALAEHATKSGVGLVLVVDPLDDLPAAPVSLRGRLLGLVAEIASAPVRSGLRAICTSREERTDDVMAIFPESASVRACLRFVGAPPAAAMIEIASGPAELAGVKVTGAKEIAADLAHEVRAESGRMAYVALALASWWGARSRDDATGEPRIGVKEWKAQGGVIGALGRHADRVLAALGEEDRAVADELLVRLAGTEGAPVRWPVSELCFVAGPASERAQDVLARLEADHLVRVREGNCELGHEELATRWSRLASARLAAMDRFVFLERLREAALTWDRSGNHADFLWRGALLGELAVRASFLEGGIIERERAFIDESKRLARRRKTTRGAAAVALAALVVLGVWAKRAADVREAEQARAAAEADRRAYLAEVIAKSRRTEDPFVRAAWIAEAVREGAAQGHVDGVLALDLAASARDVPRATFLTLEAVSAAALPWDDRWIVGTGPGATLVIVDLKPRESEVVEDVAIDADPAELAKMTKTPRTTVLLPHAEPMVQREVVSFDRALVTRSVTGDIRVLRLREDGSVALAASAPLRCRGPVRVAERAPVVACESDTGLVRWDLRRMRGLAPGEWTGAVDQHKFGGNLLDVSPDGAWLAASLNRRLVFWSPAAGRVVEADAPSPVSLGRWSPRDRALAIVMQGRVDVVDPERPSQPLLSFDGPGSPVFARWDAGGLDLSVCEEAGIGGWHYLRRGTRDPKDAAPAGPACEEPPRAAPEQRARVLASAKDAEAFGGRDLGAHPLVGGFELPDGRIVTRDLVLFGSPRPAAAELLAFHGRDPMGGEDPRGRLDSSVGVVRESEGAVAWQIGEEVRLYDAWNGRRILARKGNVLSRCDDGRVAAWRREGDATFRVFDVRSDATLGTVRREPSFVLGVDPACKTLYVQRLDGAIVAAGLDGGGEPRTIAVADGYVYEARPSAARRTTGAGMLLALGSGAIARIDHATDGVTVVGYATPRATAIGDGPLEGEVAWADATGVVVVRRDGSSTRLLDAHGATVWEDLSSSKDGASVLLASAERIAVLGVAARELLGSMPADRRARFTTWDKGGSVLAYSFGRAGGADGTVIPRGVPLALKVAESTANLGVVDRRLAIRRK